jgi:L-ascorbate metabolism protein UlaG (beta-lactamase superfamily)
MFNRTPVTFWVPPGRICYTSLQGDRLGNRYYSGPVTDHFNGKQFYHPGLPSTDKSVLDILRWRLSGKHSRWPDVVPARSGVKPDAYVDGLRITLIGHASLLVQIAGCNILVDPVWGERVSPFRRVGPRRHNPPAVALGDLPPIHAVLITHSHYDHMDTSTLGWTWQHHCPLMISPLGNDAVIRKDVPDAKVQTGDWWESFPIGNQVRVTIVPAYHWSARNLGDRRLALWGGFVLDTSAGLVYCAGDTGYQDGKIFAEIRDRLGSPLVAVLPIGAYEPRWFMSTQHVDPSQAIRIASGVGAPYLLGIHWGTFALTDEPWDEPATLLRDAIEQQKSPKLAALAMRPGDTWELH